MKVNIKLFFNPFLRDRRQDIFLILIIICLGCGMFCFEYWRAPNNVDLGTMWYFVLLSIVSTIVWLVVRFLRLLPYYQSIDAALQSQSLLEIVYLIDEEQTKEQENMKQIMYNLQKIYTTKLQEINEQQEVRHQFTMQWVHQMKTPLAVIDMQIQQARLNLSEREGNIISLAEVRSLLESISEETARLEHGLNMMLHTARLEKFEFDLNVRAVALAPLARDVINSYKKMCIQYRIYPKVTGEAIVESDSKWLSFVIQQIVGNAIKYSKFKEGTKSLMVHIEKKDNQTELTISDEGIGIEVSDIRRVFDPFFTGHNGRKTGESTGMGLYLCKQVCQRLGHPITLTSEKGVGTTVRIVFQNQVLHKM